MHLVETLWTLIIENARAFHQGLLILDKESGISGIDLRVNSGIHTNRVNGTRLDAVAAINTQEGIDLVALGKLLHVRILVLASLDVNASSGTRGRAKEAGGTLHIATIVERKTMTPTIAGGIGATLVGILNGHTRPFSKLHAKKLKGMQPKILKQSTVRDSEALEDLHNVDLLEK